MKFCTSKILFLFFVPLAFRATSQVHPTKCAHSKFTENQGFSKTFTNQNNLRSDTLDVLNYDIHLDMTNFSAHSISGACTIDFSALMDDIDHINLDLQALTVDSVLSGSGNLSFTHIGNLLRVNLPALLMTGQSSSIAVHYHGAPEQDASWGGFYYQSTYAYNLGVGFVSDPHSFGRVWFPCFDNFVERSTYAFHILTNNGKSAYCNGIRTAVDTVGIDSLVSHWRLDQTIPSYLACVAVSEYVHSQQTFQSIAGVDVPVWLVSHASDSTAMKSSFTNLLPWLDGLENAYGPYRFDRVGFVGVPFNSGAMEHATLVAYPLSAFTSGDLSQESLYAHELSHHWWGDNTTCRTEEDMWLNEGWARYSEALFQEVIYGESAYWANVRANHKDAMLHAHISDGGRYPVSGIPHAITYGDHVYNKGADVAHALRGVMGNDAFFLAIKAFMQEYASKDVSSEDLRDFFQTFTTQDLSAFFDHWVFQPGYPEFRLKNWTPSLSGDVNFTIEYHSHYAPEFYNNTPLRIRFIMNDMSSIETTIVMSSETQSFSFLVADPFQVQFIVINPNTLISEAVLDEEKMLDHTGISNFTYAEMDITIASMGSADSIWLRVENHWAEANSPAFIPLTDFYISPDRWWNVMTNCPADAQINGAFRFYGGVSGNQYDQPFFQYLTDHGLTENDLVMLYRENGAMDWEVFPSFTVSTAGNATNGIGRINVTGVKSGQYAWAVHTGAVSIDAQVNNSIVRVFFDNNSECLRVSGMNSGKMEVYNAAGMLVAKEVFQNPQPSIASASWSFGAYFVIIQTEKETLNFKVLKH